VGKSFVALANHFFSNKSVVRIAQSELQGPLGHLCVEGVDGTLDVVNWNHESEGHFAKMIAAAPHKVA
jgi:hypothetical protein